MYTAATESKTKQEESYLAMNSRTHRQAQAKSKVGGSNPLRSVLSPSPRTCHFTLRCVH